MLSNTGIRPDSLSGRPQRNRINHLALDLLVLGVRLADHADLPLAANDLAILADATDGRANLHG